MKIEESYHRQSELEGYLLDMAVKFFDDQEIEEIAFKLKSLYNEGFRHSYARFFPLIVEIFDESNVYNPEYLSNNLDSLRTLVEKDYFDNNGDKSQCRFVGLYKPLTKLSDHINLEIGRYNQSLLNVDKLKDIESRNKNLQDQVSVANRTLSLITSKMESTQKEYIAILGIFAAIVLAFTGGIAFSTSVLQNLHMTSVYRIVFITALIGIVLLNVMYGLFYYINRIVNNNSKQKIKPIIIGNAILVIILILTFCLWECGTVEKRNTRINNDTPSQIEQQVDYQNQEQ